jgi:hypothetical protein
MKKPQRTRKAVILVNTFAAAGYVCLLLAYTLFIGALAWLLIFSTLGAKPYTTILEDTASKAVVSGDMGAYFAVTMSVILVAVLSAILAYIIGKWSAHALKHFMYKTKISRTHRNLFLTKGSLAIIPLIGFIWLNVFYLGTDTAISILHVATILTALASIIIFALEFFIAKSLTVNPRDSW